ncbi:MAG: sigma-70 family RNA polymerase sigma factor [Planctomycetota bacterium]
MASSAPSPSVSTDLLGSYARTRDPEAFSALVDAYHQMVYATCLRRLGDPDQACDATQEVFVKLAASAGRVHGSVGGWLHRCACTTSIDLIRQEARRRTREASAASPDVVVELPPWEDVRVALDEALLEIPRSQRDLIVERFFNGVSQRTLAERAGVSGASMSRRVRAAVELLRDRLRSRGYIATIPLLVAGMAAEGAAATAPAGLTVGLHLVGVAGYGPPPGPPPLPVEPVGLGAPPALQACILGVGPLVAAVGVAMLIAMSLGGWDTPMHSAAHEMSTPAARYVGP